MNPYFITIESNSYNVNHITTIQRDPENFIIKVETVDSEHEHEFESEADFQRAVDSLARDLHEINHPPYIACLSDSAPSAISCSKS